ncbi:Aste57867_19109 [Aphanomyces stellatus]|uniref:non-specific serine/threonine protein kinase n=1 Tax=Aphanomyces stellatus TaxID=120398 RepID=A0A485LC34_9STRA|nr:hypothetical protein As57867_019045 [Aphanomyces stellatus]VFT95833.1 Aste57867_19109 [Aphanomyces stellatus]
MSTAATLFCNRYEILGEPVYVSKTSVVVKAIDHGIARHEFNDKARGGLLSEVGFRDCVNILSHMATKHNHGVAWWHDAFDAMEKADGHITWDTFHHFCIHECGMFQVAIKFMRSKHSSDKELNIREDMDSATSVAFVVPVVPFDAHEIARNIGQLTFVTVANMAEYQNAIVMPWAELHLVDLVKSEFDDAKKKMLKEVAEALAHLHSNDLVHGDLTKFDIVYSHGRFKLVDLDAVPMDDEPVGIKFSSGILPPEMFHRLEDDDDAKQELEHYWREHGQDHLCRIRPHAQFAIKSFCPKMGHEDLPIETLSTDMHKVDAWAFGCLMFQVLTGEELIPTHGEHHNQDIHPDGLDFIIDYNPNKLDDRLDVVSDRYARQLLKKLLAEDPQLRPSMKAVLVDQYFLNFTTQASMDDMIGEVQKAQDDTVQKLDLIRIQAKENNRKLKEQTAALIKVIEETKKTLLQAALQVNEVTVPTSFIVLPEEIHANDDVKKNKDEGDNLLKYLIDTAKTFKNAFENTAVMANELKKLVGARPMYFYLIDEVTQLPVTGTGYPIELVGETSEYATFASNCMPFIQGGFQLIKKANNVARMFMVLGMPSLDKDLVTKAGETIDSMKCTPVFLEGSLKAGTNENDVSEKVVNVYGGALRELKAFFAKHDHDERFCGLERYIDSTNGNVVWTTRPYVERLKAGDSLVKLQTDAAQARREDEERAAALQKVKLSAPTIADPTVGDFLGETAAADPKQPGECSCVFACAVM